MGPSEYYLERVGLEANVRLRLNLKNGKNSIGRADGGAGIDFGIDSLRCSAQHCEIMISGNAVQITNKSKTVGTTVNEMKMSDQSVQLKENDVIGIVRGTRIPWDLTGNYNLFVYRLRKYTSDNLLTIEIDDDETYEISDDENPIAYDDDVIILDRIDIKVENDLKIELSRDFNAEIKTECQEIDELETYFLEVKKEPSNFFEIETNFDATNAAECATLDRSDEFNPEFQRSESNDSTATLIFSPNHQREYDGNVGDEETIENVRLFVEQIWNGDTVEMGSPTGAQLVESNQIEKRQEKTGSPVEVERSVECSSGDMVVNEDIPSDRSETVDNARLFVEQDSNRLTADAVENGKRKDGPKLAEQPEKRQKKSETPRKSGRSTNKTIDKEKTTGNEKRKPKSKTATVTSNETKENETKEKPRILAKVKYTKDNRGAFLLDSTQSPGVPGLPAALVQRRKSIYIATPLPPPVPHHETNIDGADVDDEVSKLIDDNAQYSTYKIKKLSFNDIYKPKPTDSSSDSKPTGSSSNSPDTPDSGFSEKDSHPKANNVSIDETFNDQTCTGHDIDIVPTERSNGNEVAPKTPHKENVFQIDPCHEVISILTSYDFEQFTTVNRFCQSVDTNVQSFGDRFVDYAEYHGTILPLMMLELYKEIELEYENPVSQDFMNVSVSYKNIEQRGEGRRMVFHCQAEISSRLQFLYEGHLVLGRCEWNRKKIEFLAEISYVSYVKKAENLRLAHFTLETSALNEALPDQTMNLLQIRAITVISNTLNAFRSVYSLHKSPLLNLILNPLAGQPLPTSASKVAYKGYTKTLDTDQMVALKEIYNRCKNLSTANISIVDGAAGTGKSFLISDLALQLVYGDGLPKPLRILICSRSNRCIDEITKKLLHVRDKTCASQKIQLVRFGLLEQIDPDCRCVSVQHMKENEQRFIQLANIEILEKEKKTLELKVRALTLDDENDNTTELKLWKKKLIKVNTLLGRLEAVEKTKLRDATTVLLNACDIICTTLGSINRLQSYIPNVDVCIIDEASHCDEALTLLPLRFGMSSLVLFGDSCAAPPMVFSQVANEKNYGNSLFRRVHKLYSSESGSPLFHLNIQHRMHPEIGQWPNSYFYKNNLLPSSSNSLDNLPIVPYKMISYAPGMESDNIMFVVDFLCGLLIDANRCSISVICTNTRQTITMREKLSHHPYVGVHSANESHLVEKDVVIIWISKEHGMSHLSDNTLFNRAVTRAKRSLLICGADLQLYKSRPMWKSIMENAQDRKCYVHLKKFLQSKLNTLLRRKV